MDTNICGLNKVVCRALSSSYAGRTVTITNGVNTWSGIIAEITGVGYACVFMVPSLPAPAKRTYTVTLYNSAGTSPEYQRDIELGFGDSMVIGLYTNAEIADKAYVLSEIDNHAYVLPKATSGALGGVMVPSANGLSVDANGNVRMSVAGTDSVGAVKPGTGLQINSTTGAISLKQADANNIGGVKVGTGLLMNPYTGTLSLDTADSDYLGGIKQGRGLRIDSDQKANVYFTRSEIRLPLDSSITIPGKSFQALNSIRITETEKLNILNQGIIESITGDSTGIEGIVSSLYLDSDYAILKLILLNSSTNSVSTSEVYVHACRFA